MPREDVILRAAATNNLDAVRLLRAHGWPCGAPVCAEAAKHGHLELLKALRADSCEWDAATTKAAAAGQHFALLHWAIANGCEADDDARAAIRDHAESEPAAHRATSKPAPSPEEVFLESPTQLSGLALLRHVRSEYAAIVDDFAKRRDALIATILATYRAWLVACACACACVCKRVYCVFVCLCV